MIFPAGAALRCDPAAPLTPHPSPGTSRLETRGAAGSQAAGGRAGRLAGWRAGCPNLALNGALLDTTDAALSVRHQLVLIWIKFMIISFVSS